MEKSRIVAKIPGGFQATLEAPSMEEHVQINLLLKALLGTVYILSTKCEDRDAQASIRARFYGQIMAACEQAVRSCSTASKISTNTPKNVVDAFLRSLEHKDNKGQDTS